MTIQALIATVEDAGIVLAVEGDTLRVKGPAGALTSELRAELTAQKPAVIPVITRLSGMRRNAANVPVPCAVLEAVGGPGRCFSCGDSLEHAEAYGRCVPCAIAAELYYAAAAPESRIA